LQIFSFWRFVKRWAISHFLVVELIFDGSQTLGWRGGGHKISLYFHFSRKKLLAGELNSYNNPVIFLPS
jgi:hypothetical protein